MQTEIAIRTMHTARICNPLRVALKHSALAVAVAVGLAVGSVHAAALTWAVAGGGAWDDTTANWTGGATIFAGGDEVTFNNAVGGTITIASAISPASTTVSATGGTYAFSGSPVASGSLTKSGGGTLQLNVTPANFSSIAVNGGTLYLYAAETGFAPNAAPFTIPNVTVESGATLEAFRAHATGGTLTLNGGRYWEWNGWNDGGWWGPIYLAANSYFGRTDFYCYAQTLGGEISGPGGFTYDSYNNQQGSPLTLSVANSYSGPTIVNSGKVVCKDPSSLGSGGALSIGTSGKVALNYTGNHAVASLTLGGVTMTNPGTYGSLASAATFKSAYFDGTGTVSYGAPESAAYITSFGTNVTGSGTTIGTVASNAATITWLVPGGTDLASLAPDFVLSSGATCSQRNTGDLPVPGFGAGPVVYTIRSQDLSITNIYTVTAEYLPAESTVLWNVAGGGIWNLSTFNWLGQTSGLPTTFVTGINAIFNKTVGGTIVIDPGMEPLSTTVSAASGNYTFSGGPIAGTGSLTKSGAGTLKIDDLVSGTGTVVSNTYTGGTIMNSGTLHLGGMFSGISPDCRGALGTGTVTLNGGMIEFDRYTDSNALIVNGGTLYSQNGWGATWSGPITLNATLTCNTGYGLTCSGAISGAGGLNKVGGDTLMLSGTNTYTGPTTINAGTVAYNSAVDQTLTGDISGPGKLTKGGSGSLTLTGVVSYTGATTLTAGTLVLSNSADQTLPGAISGAGNLTQAGPGRLTLTGLNTYTGVTTVSGGILAVNGTSLSDTGKLVIDTGGKVEATGTEIVDIMFFGTTPQAAGTWGASGSGADHIDDDRFIGTAGVVSVTNMAITGKVTLEDGTTPIEGVMISAVGGLLTSSTHTLADGTYSVPAKGGDTVDVTATKAKYVVTHPVTNLFTIHTATDPATDINFKMMPLPISKLVDLKAKDLTAGPITDWTNAGTAGGVFTTIAGTGTAPEVKDVGGTKAVAITAGYGLASSFNTPAAITGANPWTMAAWVYRSADLPWQGSEECVIGLGNASPNYDLVILNYSNDPDWGYIDSGVMNFGNANPPARGVWHSIVATYDGVTLNYYADKVLLKSGSGSLRTPGEPMTIGFIYDGTGIPGWSVSWASIASIEVYDGALSKTSIDAIYDAGLASPSYSTWASTNAPGQTPDQDYDHDGVQNGIEYFMGKTGSSFTAMPGLDRTNTVTWPKSPAYNGTWQIQTSPDLVHWTDVAGTDNTTSVSYTLPTGRGKWFLRLLVTPAQ